MIKKDIKVKPKDDDINRTMFLSVFSGFELQLSKDYDNDYFLSLNIMPSENDFGKYLDDYYVYDISNTISLDNISTITEDIIKDIKKVLSGITDVTNRSIINNEPVYHFGNYNLWFKLLFLNILVILKIH